MNEHKTPWKALKLPHLSGIKQSLLMPALTGPKRSLIIHIGKENNLQIMQTNTQWMESFYTILSLLCGVSLTLWCCTYMKMINV